MSALKMQTVLWGALSSLKTLEKLSKAFVCDESDATGVKASPWMGVLNEERWKTVFYS